MRRKLIATLVTIAAMSGCKSRDNTAADNTARNQRDRSVTPTADNAVATQADLEITQNIRKSVLDDSSLSANAHNCKIVVRHGAVTLAGPVASDAERAKVEQLAVAVVGSGKVSNQLEVTN